MTVTTFDLDDDNPFTDLLSKLRRSAAVVVISPGPDPDVKICVEVGAAILLNKPIFVLVPEDRECPRPLRRFARAVIEGGQDEWAEGLARETKKLREEEAARLAGNN